jgi:hypothetical protein
MYQNTLLPVNYRLTTRRNSFTLSAGQLQDIVNGTLTSLDIAYEDDKGNTTLLAHLNSNNLAQCVILKLTQASTLKQDVENTPPQWYAFPFEKIGFTVINQPNTAISATCSLYKCPLDCHNERVTITAQEYKDILAGVYTDGKFQMPDGTTHCVSDIDLRNMADFITARTAHSYWGKSWNPHNGWMAVPIPGL